MYQITIIPKYKLAEDLKRGRFWEYQERREVGPSGGDGPVPQMGSVCTFMSVYVSVSVCQQLLCHAVSITRC